MFDELLIKSKIRLSKIWIIPIMIVLGMAGLSFGWLRLPWIWLPITSSISLIVTFGWSNFKKFFKFPVKKDWKTIFQMGLLAYGLAMLVFIIGSLLFHLKFSANPILNSDKSSILISLLFIWISLVGEELIVASVVLPIYSYLAQRKTNKKNAWLIALIVGSVFFGMLHLPTYSWNWYHAVVIIGLARVPFSMAWKKTDSLLGGIFTHIIYDYVLILIVLLGM
ncbi:CPBP family glutamic-type intramembrane protease [Companilactobacillus sp. DQM5]|uniref:CPBP family glutamic-type intramembrane protease n=1 Tax=Companilactobacillus sp. DQM5 TaxID=3463359 RepID=UPI0040584CB7